MKNLLLIMCSVFLVSSCAKPDLTVRPIPEPLEEIKSVSVTHHEAGSLWLQSDTSIFSDRKANNIGDIVTVLISEKASASKKATTQTGRTTNISASMPNFFGLEQSDLSPVDLDNLINAEFTNGFDGNGTTSRKEDLTASLSAQVIKRYPNGQLKIRGGKEVMVNNEVQIIYLTGIIRSVDITAANTVYSDKILNARISYTGKGAVSDKQQPGWMMRTLDNVWPF
jgi:flagellar L-ring protein precursor FlgH